MCCKDPQRVVPACIAEALIAMDPCAIEGKSRYPVHASSTLPEVCYGNKARLAELGETLEG
jgi:hypothetical protein